MATLEYFCAQLDLLDIFEKEQKEQLIQNYGLLGKALEQLQRLSEVQGEEQSKLLVIRLLT